MGDLVSRMHSGPRLGARAAFWCAWSLWALSVVTTAALLTYSAIHPLPAKIRGSPAEAVIAVAFIGGFATVGALLGWKRPANPIGWLMCGTALSYTAGDVGQLLLSRFARTQALGAWLGWAWLFGLGLVALVLLLFPTGALPSRRWRPVAWAAAAGLAGWVLGNAFGPAILSDDSYPANPFGIGGGVAGTVFWILAIGGAALIPLSGAAAVVSLVFRYRRARTGERAQLKWLVFAAGLIVVAILASIGASSQLQNAVTSGAIAAVPVAIGVAIFRYRLYDIDVVINKTVVFGTLTVAITAIYAAIVAGIGTLAGRQGSLLLAALAAAVVAVAFQPLRQRAQHLANRVVYGRRATPYEVLSDFSGRVAGTYATEDVLPQMARILAGGTGATSAGVWLATGPELRLSAAWPEQASGPGAVRLAGDSVPAIPGAGAVVPVRHQGQLLGALAVTMPPTEPLTPVGEKLVRDLAAQAGLVVRNVRLVEDLLASRQRLVAAQDQERRKLERNLHDGAQQQLVALAVKQRLAADLVRQDPDQAIAMLADLRQDTGEALENLRELARGIYPPLLADLGLVAALESRARKSPVPVAIDADGAGRYAQQVEAAVYFCCLEAMQNVAKYAGASTVHIHLANEEGWLTFSVADDGHGYDSSTTAMGSGIQNMADRLSALGGSLNVRSVPGGGTTVAGRIPVGVE
jgi:signal transduction histidine kinase